MSNQAIQKELSRVRALKRASESEVEYLRSEMEQGNLHIRVSEDEDFRQEIAEAIIKMSQPSWSWEYQGGYYADPVEGQVFFKESNAPWNPWSDSIDFRIVPVGELVNQENNDFDPSVDWNLVQSPITKAEIIVEWQKAFPDEDFGDYDFSEILNWALEQDRRDLTDLIQEIEDDFWNDAIDFAKSEIKDEIVV